MISLSPLRYPAIIAALAVFMSWGCAEDPAAPAPGGSDVTLDPPPAGQGMQIAIGPFDAPAGQEVQKNYYQKLPNTEEIYVTKIEFRFNPGSHHMNIFKSDNIDVPDHVEDTFNAIAWESWDMVAASQRGNFTWTLPPGVAIKLNPRQQMIFQTHYVNAATQNAPLGRGKVLVNFWTTDKANVTSTVGAVFSNNRVVKIPPFSSATFCKVIPPFKNDVNMLLMTGHFHSRGKTFTVGHWDGTKLIDTIYHSAAWSDPPILQFATPLTIRAGDSLAYFTTFENRTEDEIKFGPHVEYEEHANLFAFYYPAPPGNKAIYDFTGGFLVSTQRL